MKPRTRRSATQTRAGQGEGAIGTPETALQCDPGTRQPEKLPKKRRGGGIGRGEKVTFRYTDRHSSTAIDGNPMTQPDLNVNLNLKKRRKVRSLALAGGTLAGL